MKKEPATYSYIPGGRRLTRAQVFRLFRKSAKDNQLLGNDFIAIATLADRTWCPYLRKLKSERKWSDGFDGLHVEGAWVVVVCRWLEEGGDGLVRLVRESEHGDYYRGMCFSILGRQQGPEAIDIVAAILPLRFRLARRPDEFERANSWCWSLCGIFVSAKKGFVESIAIARIRQFAHLFLKKAVSKVNKAISRKQLKPNQQSRIKKSFDILYFSPGIHLLSHVGNESSIALIDNLPDWSEPVQEHRARIIKNIQDRNRQAIEHQKPPTVRRIKSN